MIVIVPEALNPDVVISRELETDETVEDNMFALEGEGEADKLHVTKGFDVDTLPLSLSDLL